MVELSAEARQGDSGGPIFNQQGELAGVLFGSGPGYTSGSYGGRVLGFLTTVVPGGVPGTDGAAPNTALAAGAPTADAPINPLGPPPLATALHQPVAPAESRTGPPANQLPGDVASLTPAGPAVPGSLLSPPERQLHSDRFGEATSDALDVDPKAAVNLERLAANTPIGDPPLSGVDASSPGANLLQSSLPPRGGVQAAPATDIQSAPTDQLLAAAWQKIGGPSVIDQIKTVLAGIGVLGILVLFFRMSRRSEPEGEAD
jgi:hypothetical protein